MFSVPTKMASKARVGTHLLAGRCPDPESPPRCGDGYAALPLICFVHWVVALRVVTETDTSKVAPRYF